MCPLMNDTQEPLMAIHLLRNLTSSGQLEPAVTLYLLGDILNRYDSTNNEIRESLIEVVRELW